MPNNKVSVYVDSKGAVTCVPNTLETGRSWRSFRIFWYMESDNWEITGISKPGGGDLDPNIFHDSKKNGRGWKIKDKNPEPGVYEYEVHVRRMETGECVSHDPAIKNGGRR